jgi:Flp pilus assembly protein TadD/ketosteroid isomerase-like protein
MTIRNLFLLKLLAPFILALSFASIASADELKDISQMAESGQQAQALERINTYLAANPKDAQAMFMKGIILAETGKRDDAIKAFTDLTEKYPNLPEPYNNLAVLYADAGQYDKAKKALETAIKTHPSYATAHENLGDIYARMASEAYDKALQLDGSNARAQSKLAMIKDLFGTGGKTTAAAKPADNKVADNSKTAKTGTIRPADKKVEPPKPVADTKPAADTGAGDEQAINEAVDNWAKAWSAKDVDKYLASYAESFKPAKGESRKTWEDTRRERVSKPASINVELANQKVTLDGADSAKVNFKQTYRAGGKPIRTDKTLMMKKTNGTWLIEQELASN